MGTTTRKRTPPTNATLEVTVAVGFTCTHSCLSQHDTEVPAGRHSCTPHHPAPSPSGSKTATQTNIVILQSAIAILLIIQLSPSGCETATQTNIITVGQHSCAPHHPTPSPLGSKTATQTNIITVGWTAILLLIQLHLQAVRLQDKQTSLLQGGIAIFLIIQLLHLQAVSLQHIKKHYCRATQFCSSFSSFTYRRHDCNTNKHCYCKAA